MLLQTFWSGRFLQSTHLTTELRQLYRKYTIWNIPAHIVSNFATLYSLTRPHSHFRTWRELKLELFAHFDILHTHLMLITLQIVWRKKSETFRHLVLLNIFLEFVDHIGRLFTFWQCPNQILNSKVKTFGRFDIMWLLFLHFRGCINNKLKLISVALLFSNIFQLAWNQQPSSASIVQQKREIAVFGGCKFSYFSIIYSFLATLAGYLVSML